MKKDQKTNDIYNLSMAVQNNDMQAVSYIVTKTPSPFKILVKHSSVFNQLLQNACAHGNLEMVKFFLSYQSDMEQSEKQTFKIIKDALSCSVRNQKKELILFFKKNYIEIFSFYCNSTSKANKAVIDRDFLCLNDLNGVKTMEMIYQELSAENKALLDKKGCLGLALHGSSLQTCNWWLSKMEGNELKNYPYLAQKLLVEALILKKNNLVDKMIDQFKLNLSELITLESLTQLIMSNMNSIDHLVDHHQYKIPPQHLKGLKKDAKMIPPETDIAQSLNKFLKELEIKDEKKKLNQHLTTPVVSKKTSHKI